MENSPINILLADDDETDRLIFIDAFEELKIKNSVETVNNGVQLMAYLNKKNARLPHLLFLDLNMPLKNGLECLKEIRSDSRFAEISIAIYSTSESEKDIQATFQNGANVYIKKPNDFGLLKQVLEKVVKSANIYRLPPFDITNFVLKI